MPLPYDTLVIDGLSYEIPDDLVEKTYKRDLFNAYVCLLNRVVQALDSDTRDFDKTVGTRIYYEDNRYFDIRYISFSGVDLHYCHCDPKPEEFIPVIDNPSSVCQNYYSYLKKKYLLPKLNKLNKTRITSSQLSILGKGYEPAFNEAAVAVRVG